MAKKIARGTGLGLVAGLLFGSLMAMNAFASVGPCRSDPAVLLSNGVTVTLYETISDSASDVNSIAYTLDVPKGVTVRSVSYSGAVPVTVQAINTSANENSGNYDGYTTVNTGSANVPVTAYMSAGSTVSCQTAGHSGQLQHSHLHLS